MKRLQWIVAITTLFAIVYQFTPVIDISGRTTLLMFTIAPLLVIWMGYNILKHGKSSKLTFDEQFYEDWDYKRNGKEEL
jgi:hypothetical protein